MKSSLVALALVGASCFTACSRMPTLPNPVGLVAGPATLHVDVPAKPGALPMQRAGRTLNVVLTDFEDGRSGRPGRKVGDIRTTVRGMHGSEILLDEEVPALVSRAVRSQLAADGFRLVGAGAPADFALTGTVKSFSLNVAGRDERLMALEATVREGAAGDVVWAGLITDQDERFAGVNGNSRDTIAEYLGEGAAEVAGKLSAAVRDSLARAYPQTLAVSASPEVSAIPGVKTLRAPTVREQVAAAPPDAVRPAPSAAPAPMPAAAGTIGQLAINSLPSRAKVYVEDVYFGLAPLKVELPVGVSLVRLKLDGYKTVTEKVSVRRGETTEMEVRFEK